MTDLHTSCGHLSDEEWRDVILRGLTEPTFAGAPLPAFPADETQVRFTSMKERETVDEAYAFFKLAKAACARAGRPLQAATRLLDFGVGWGRIVRMFLKDVAAEHVFGVDVNEDILRECRRLMPYGTYLLCRHDEPLAWSDDTFDLAVSFSVFSHLSPAASRRWLAELHRVLVPGGLLVLTTLSRSFVEHCRVWTERPGSDFERHMAGLVTAAYPDWRRRFADFDPEGYLYLPAGGGLAALEPEHYGWAMVTRPYAERHWGAAFEILDHLDDPRVLKQACFVLRKRPAA